MPLVREVAVTFSYNPTPPMPLGLMARVVPAWSGNAQSDAVPDEAADLVADLNRRMPEARITDILIEVDDATRFNRGLPDVALALDPDGIDASSWCAAHFWLPGVANGDFCGITKRAVNVGTSDSVDELTRSPSP